MLPISFKFVGIGMAQQAKGQLYRFHPSRTVSSPQWTNDGTAMNGEDVKSPYTDPSQWQDRYALCVLTFEKESGERLVMNDAVVAITRKKNVVTTSMVGMDGTVKEHINMDDYQISIAVGVQAMHDGIIVDEYPEEGLRQLRSFFDVNEAIYVQSSFLDIFDIDKIVITDFSVTQATESNYQEVDISALSDSDYEVYSTDY